MLLACANLDVQLTYQVNAFDRMIDIDNWMIARVIKHKPGTTANGTFEVDEHLRLCELIVT
eukprot:6189935-Pleurochrysis_carterae.AAC.2